MIPHPHSARKSEKHQWCQPHPTSLDDSILTYIRCMQCSSSKSPSNKRQQSISKKQICNFFTIDYDTTTTKKDVKRSLKRLVKRGVVSINSKGYSYIQPHQVSVDSSTSSDKGYPNQKVDEPSDGVATGSRDLSSGTTDIEPLSLDENILSYIRDCCRLSFLSGAQTTSISKKQIQKHYDSIVDDYDTSKKDVKHLLKRLLKRNVIVKVGKKKYSYIQPQQSIDICTLIATTNRTNGYKRKRQPEESSDHESASTTESTTVKKKYKYICTYEGCTNQVQTQGVCTKHGAKRKKYACSHEGCKNHVVKKGVCIRHGATWTKKTCEHEGCANQVVNRGVCVKHGAIQRPRKMCEHKGCDNRSVRLGLCRRHGSYS